MTDVARYLSLPKPTVRAWVAGTKTGRQGQQRKFHRVIKPAKLDGITPVLSFVNLCEVYTLSSLRRNHRINLQVIRALVKRLIQEFGVEHPLTYPKLYVDANARELFADIANSLLSATGQLANAAVLARYLERVEVEPSGVPIRVFPFANQPSTLKEAQAAPRYVVIDPLRAFGRACIVGTRVPIEEVALRFKAGESLDQIAADFGRTRNECEAALRLYQRAA